MTTTLDRPDSQQAIDLIGRLTNKPEIHSTEMDSVARLGIAVPRRRGKDGQDRGAQAPPPAPRTPGGRARLASPDNARARTRHRPWPHHDPNPERKRSAPWSTSLPARPHPSTEDARRTRKSARTHSASRGRSLAADSSGRRPARHDRRTISWPRCNRSAWRPRLAADVGAAARRTPTCDRHDSDAEGRAAAERIAADVAAHVDVQLIDLAPHRVDGYDLTVWLQDHREAVDIDALCDRCRAGERINEQ